jgi:pimeloyl-ACP methyl ester carboxylesterase
MADRRGGEITDGGTTSGGTRRRVEVRDGIELSVIEWRPDAGAARFVLVHGLSSNARTWDGVAAELARNGRPSVAVDLRGHGRSDKPDDGYDVASVADDVLMLIARIGLERPVLVGQSWGGNVVIEAAARDPGAISAVVGVDGGMIHLAEEFPDWETCARMLAPPDLVGTPVAAMEARMRAAHPDWPESGIAGTLANMEVRPDGTVAPWLTRARHMTILRGLWEHDPHAAYPRIRVPVVLAPARNDRTAHGRAITRAHHVEAALREIPDARVVWFEGADHDIHAQRPVDLAALLMTLDGT